jgi:hypothetical protein
MAKVNTIIGNPAPHEGPPESDLRFQEVTRQYQVGDLTLGEAAEALGISRWDYAARLRDLHITQVRDPRTPEELKQLEEMARAQRG